jgi:uncharacterized protein (DUF362 family)
MVLIPVAVGFSGELVELAAGALVLLDVLGVELLLLPHAAIPTTAAAARKETANHRLRIEFFSHR